MKGKFIPVKIAALKRRPLRHDHGSEEELKALARSWLKRAIHPILCRPDLTVADGHRRLAGLELLGETEALVYVTDENLTDTDLIEIGMVSALHRADLAPYSQAVAVKDWAAHHPGATAKELAEKIDRDPSMLTRLNSLWKTVPAVVKAAEEGQIGPKAWYQISLLPESEQAGLLEMYLAGLPAAQIAELGRKKRTAATTPPVKVGRLRCVLPSGFQVVVSGDGVSLESSIEALNDAIKEMRRAKDLGYTAKTFAACMKDKAKKG